MNYTGLLQSALVALAGFVVEHVITIAYRRPALDGLSRGRIDDEKPGRIPSDDEQPVVGFVEGHRIIRQRHPERPGRDDRARLPAENSDLARLWQVYVNARSAFLHRRILDESRV